MESRQILVTDLPDGTDKTQLTIHFQSARLSGGGDVKNIELRGGGQAIITFKDVKAASRVCQQPHVFQGCSLRVALLPELVSTPKQDTKLDDASMEVDGFSTKSTRNERGADYERIGNWHLDNTSDAKSSATGLKETVRVTRTQGNSALPHQCTVKVTGLPKGVSKDLVLNYFENARRSKGGPVSSVIMKPEIQTCLVTFESGDDAKTTAEYSPHTVNDLSFKVSLLHDPKDSSPEDLDDDTKNEDSVDEITVTVSGMLSNTTKDGVRNYFENSRRSGGGEISTIEYNEGVAVITFAEVKDEKHLLESSHFIDDKNVTVVKQPPKKKIPPDPLKLLVKGLTERTTKDCLRFYLEKFTDVDVIDVYFGCDASTALATFASEPDFFRLFDEVSKDTKGLEGAKPRLERVPTCSCILVTGLKEETSDDIIHLYFESEKRSGGKDVSHVEKQGKSKALVYFEHPSSVESVIRKCHTLDKVKLSVRPYYRFLEKSATDSPGNDTVRNKTQIKVDPDVILFIQTSRITELQTLLAQSNANLSVDAENLKVTISPSDNENCSSQSWQERVQTIEQYLHTFTKLKIDVVSELFDEVKQHWQSQSSSQRQGNVLLSFNAASHFVQIIGETKYAEKVKQELHELIHTVEENAEHKKSIIQLVEDRIPRARLALLEMSGFCERLQKENQHLSISVDLEKEELRLEGPTALVQAAKVEALKFNTMDTVVERTVELPGEVVEVIKRPPVSKYFQQLFKQNGIQAIVLHDQTKNSNEVQIVGVDSESTKKAKSILQDSIQERNLRLAPGNTQVLHGRTWNDFKTSLSSKYRVGITLDASSSIIWIRGIGKDVKECLDEVTKFHGVNTVQYTRVPLEQGITNFLFKVWKSKLEGIEKELSTYCVHIRVAPKEEGIEVCGTAEGLQKCMPRLHELINTVETDCVPVNKPGMKRFISQEKGPKLLKAIEHENHCIILPSETAATNSSVMKTEMALEDPGQSSAECMCSYFTREGKMISVFKDDITKHRVDAIVNPANKDLKHSGGLARTIVQAGGVKIQDQCDAFIRDIGGPLLDGQAMVTSAGKLPCDHIIHVVGPKWNPTKDDMRRMSGKVTQEKYLSCAITNSLKEANKLKSVAIPAVSSGSFGFPRDLCAKVVIDAVIDFCKETQLAIYQRFILRTMTIQQ